MKKIFTLIAAALTVVSASAKDYTCPLTVSVNGAEMPAGDVTVTVNEQENGKYTLSLLNFSLSPMMAIGNIVVNDVDVKECGIVTALSTQQTINIAAGDDATKIWMGPTLGPVPVLMKAEMKGEALNAVLNIAMSADMMVGVKLGDKADELGQIPNSGFEDYHTATVSMDGNSASGDEPNGWHSFMSASGSDALVYLAGYSPHVFKVSDTRPGSTGKYSVKLLALDMWIAIANGTLTTGRMNTGSSTAADTDSNYAWCDLSSTDTDDNGDPFYAVQTGTPDSLKVWIKYGQGKPNADHPYATVTAIVTDGTLFHEPAPSNTTYGNVVCEARNAKIESTNGEWKELTIPFEMKSESVEPKAILLTISTNADAGKGSNNDTILVDDLSLIYNATLTGIKVNGNGVTDNGNGTFSYTGAGTISAADIDVTTDGKGAYVTKKLQDDGKGGCTVLITVTSNDLKTANNYTLNVSGMTTGISKAVAVTTPAGISAVYSVNGQMMSSMNRPGIYIVKTADGKMMKVLKK